MLFMIVVVKKIPVITEYRKNLLGILEKIHMMKLIVVYFHRMTTMVLLTGSQF